MSQSINEVHLLGRAGRDAETKYVSTGKSVTKISLATGGGKKKDGGEWPTEWTNVEVWESEPASEVKKGQEVEIWGRLKTDQWEKNGEKRYSTKVVANKIEVTKSDDLPTKVYSSSQHRTPPVNANSEIDLSDIPF